MHRLGHLLGVGHGFHHGARAVDRVAGGKHAGTAGVAVFVGEEQQGRHFEIPSGVYLGMDTADYRYEFFLDEACTEVYDHESAVVTEDIVIYVRPKA